MPVYLIESVQVKPKNTRRTNVDAHFVLSLGAKVNKNKFASLLFIQN